MGGSPARTDTGALLMEGGRLRRSPPDEVEANGAPAWRSLRPLPDFITVHRDQLDEVVRLFRNQSTSISVWAFR